jgi:hypothetical protein
MGPAGACQSFVWRDGCQHLSKTCEMLYCCGMGITVLVDILLSSTAESLDYVSHTAAAEEVLLHLPRSSSAAAAAALLLLLLLLLLLPLLGEWQRQMGASSFSSVIQLCSFLRPAMHSDRPSVSLGTTLQLHCSDEIIRA